MELAFRLYGHFHWPLSANPPSEKSPDPQSGIAAGVVEIFFAKKGASKNWTALLNWRPRADGSPQGQPDLEEEPAEPTESFFGKTQKQIAEWFEARKETGGAIWLDAPASGAKKPKVAFRGAFLLQQVGGSDALQWPLVARSSYVKGITSFSELVVYWKGDNLFRFNLHLPLPVQRTKPDGDYTNAPAFPFCAVYKTEVPAADAKGPQKPFLTANSIVAGWIGESATKPPKAVPSYTLLKEEAPDTLRLGAFGFATKRDSYFAKVHRPFLKANGDPDPNYDQPERYWPGDLTSSFRQALLSYGFAVGKANNAVSLQEMPPADLSLRFGPDKLIYRIAIDKGFDTGDLQKPSARLRLRLNPELAGPVASNVSYNPSEIADELDVDEKLAIDCELSWSIAPEDIWAENRTEAWRPKIRVSLVFDNPLFTLSQPAIKDGVLTNGLLALANCSMEKARLGLIAVESGLPHSFLPQLVWVSGTTVRFGLYGPELDAVIDPKTSLVSWGSAADPANWIRPSMRLTLAGKTLLEPEAELSVDLEDISFFQTGDTALAATLTHDANWIKADREARANDNSYFASYGLILETVKDVKGGKEWSGRLGALQFSDSTRPGFRGVPGGHLRIGGEGFGRAGQISQLVYPAGMGAVSIAFPIPVGRVEAVSVDVARGDRSGRPSPMLIPLDPDGKSEFGDKPAYWLQVVERIAPRQDRWLEVDLTDNESAVGNRSFVVLSHEPFSILKFTHRPLSDRGSAESASVAVYSGDTRLWQYKRVSDHYHYVFPPQTIGESSDKPRRLEIHDLRESDNAIRPYAEILPGEPSGLRRRAVEFRLTPSAEIWIKPSDVERGYFIPESTSHEIFRQYGEYGLGAQLAYMRAEFLYGLPVGVDVAKEAGVARGARVAEIEALTGRLPGGGRQDAEVSHSNRWNALRGAIANRPERLEVWARDLDSTIDFTPARFSTGVRFALRETALHRHPLGPDLGSDFKKLPKSGEDEAVNGPRHHPQGLSGGALWPLESNNLFKVLLDTPESTGGEIEQIALSPIGGDAAQKAAFLGGLVTIISETRNGQVQRQQVEVLGRIGALWHRAKHVVVYERTVNASPQFAPLSQQDEKRTRSRRPILRKVREYIELLQPERSYPDIDAAEKRSSGFLERVRFNSNIINVDSAWSNDVGDFGWTIPLWNRLAARQRPQVYPMPDVAFVTTAEGEGEKPVVAQECLDPDYLRFFSEFKAGSDTDAWLPRLDIDYPNMPSATAIAAYADEASAKQPADIGDETEGRRRSVRRFLPGLRQFSWRLAPAAQKTALNAGRAGKPVYVGLDTVTFMRALQQGQQGLSGDLVSAIKESAKIDRSSPGAKLLAEVIYWKTGDIDPSRPFKELFNKFASDKGALAKAIESGSPTAISDVLQKELKPNWEGLKTDIVADLKKQVDGDLTDLKGFATSFKQGPAFCEKLAQDTIGMVQRKEMLLRATVADVIGDGKQLLDELGNAFTKTTLREHLVDKVVDRIRPLFEEASQDIGKLDEGVEKARAIVLDLETDIDAILQRAGRRIDDFVAGYDETKPWSVDRRKAFRAGLKAAVSSFAGDVDAALSEARQRLAIELNDVSQAVGGHIATLLTKVTEAQLEANVLVDRLGDFVKEQLARIEEGLARFEEASTAPPLTKIDKLIADANKIGNPDLRDRVVKALENLKAARSTALGLIEVAREKVADVDAAADAAEANVKDAAAVAASSITDLLVEIGQDAQSLLDDYEAVLGDAGEVLAKDLNELILNDISRQLNHVADFSEKMLVKVGTAIDAMVIPTAVTLRQTCVALQVKIRKVPQAVLPVIDDVRQALQSAQLALAPGNLVETLVQLQIVEPAIDALLQPLPEQIDPNDIELARLQIIRLEEKIGDLIRALKDDALGAIASVTAACKAVHEGIQDAAEWLGALAGDYEAHLKKKLEEAGSALFSAFEPLPATIDDAEKLLASLKSFDYAVRRLQNDLIRTYETAGAYADRVFDVAGKLGEGGVMAAPCNVLKLYAAVTSAPELAALKADIDRLRAGFDEFADIIETTKANALFNRLGDELKGLGLSLPFDKIGDRLLPADLGNFDIGKVFRNFGGAKLDRLFKGYKIPPGVSDAVKVTHDFDEKQARAWVQVDINASMPGRRSLFSVGPFKADFVDMQLRGQVRLEASKDQDKVTQTGFGRIGTIIDLAVGGQSMVSFTKFGLNFTREKGLEIEFDPTNIRLNPQFKFIQDFLSTLFGGDEPGGLKIINEGGLPVGVEHEFIIPPVSLNFGTSGVQNISIENRFRLVAYPDFMLADRFNLSTVERPFIFSIFIIGGTGYIQLEAQYRPFDSELMVLVEAGAGGSASLAFAFGPFSGQVFITLSGTISYRKLIGKGGGGLAISVVLVIAGHVDVAGIVTIGITLMLRMTYRDNGQVDGEGTLSVTIRISKFFKLKARADIKYKLRGGKSETNVNTSAGVDPGAKVAQIQKAAQQLEQARS